MSQLEIVERSSGFWIVDNEPIDGPFADYDAAHDALLLRQKPSSTLGVTNEATTDSLHQ
jgi:hypothetical protein